MKYLHGVKYIEKELLDKNNIIHPIKLENYKVKELGSMYGIEIVKTEYLYDGLVKESKMVKGVTNNKCELHQIIEKLKRGTVTPITAEEIIEEIKQEEELKIEFQEAIL